MDNGFTATQLGVKDCVVYGLEPNAPLRSMMLREIQYGMRFNRLKEIQAPEKNLRGALESMLTLKGFVRREVGNAGLWAICAGADPGKCVLLNGKDSSQKFLAVFTTPALAKAFAQKLNPTIKPVEMKFDELVQRGAEAEGLLIDVGTAGYRIPKAEYDQVRDLRAKPPVLVRLQPREGENPQPKTQPEMQASLPNPDDFDLPAKAQTPAETPSGSSEEPAPNPPERKGFFKKLFGK